MISKIKFVEDLYYDKKKNIKKVDSIMLREQDWGLL